MTVLEGRIRSVDQRTGYGFIDGDDGQEYFVHATAVAQGGFDDLAVGDRVQFEAFVSSKGPRAGKVRKVS